MNSNRFGERPQYQHVGHQPSHHHAQRFHPAQHPRPAPQYHAQPHYSNQPQYGYPAQNQGYMSPRQGYNSNPHSLAYGSGFSNPGHIGDAVPLHYSRCTACQGRGYIHASGVLAHNPNNRCIHCHDCHKCHGHGDDRVEVERRRKQEAARREYARDFNDDGSARVKIPFQQQFRGSALTLPLIALPYQLQDKVDPAHFNALVKKINDCSIHEAQRVAAEMAERPCIASICCCFFDPEPRDMSALYINGFVQEMNTREMFEAGVQWFYMTNETRAQGIPAAWLQIHVKQPTVEEKVELAFNKQIVQMQDIARRAEQAIKANSVKIDVKSGGPFQKLKFSELELGKEIGSGAFGTVYISTWRGSKVVVKKLKSELVDRASVQEFIAEAEVSERCGRHPNVVSFIGACVEHPNLCLVTEFVANGSIEDAVMQKKMFSKPNEMYIIAQMATDAAAGVMHLHSEGVVHRDIAARNFLLDDLYRCKVCDFGMSRIAANDADDSSQTVTKVGPLKWMSPESLSNQEYSEKSDVWMFGVFLWELFTRLEPYPNMKHMEAAMAVAKENYRMVPPETIPEEIRELMQECWQTSPGDRPRMKDIHARLALCTQRLLDECKREMPAVDPASGYYDAYEVADESAPLVQHT